MTDRSTTFRRCLRWAALTILAAIGAAVLAGAVLIRVDHLTFQPVLSGSMRPGIQPGDLAVLRPGPVSQLRVGEVIAYLPPGHTLPVMHRVVSIDAGGLVTKGDANNVADPWGRVKTQSATVDHLVAVVPKVGWLTEVRRQLLVAAGAVVLLALAVALFARKTRQPSPDLGAAADAELRAVQQSALLTQQKEN